MKAYCLQSAKAELNAADHLTYLTSAKFGDGEWRGSAETFLLNWRDRLRKHEDTLKEKSKRLGDDLKRTLLQNAVSLIPQLNDVKLRADQYRAASGHDTTYQQYHTFLVTVAQQYDRVFTKNSTPSRRKVYQHDIYAPGITRDSSTHTTLPFTTSTLTPKPFLFIRLTPDHRPSYQTPSGRR
jgi:hypothetical protein